ncbi:MAG: TrkH family potassium uptake protein [Firmicutes bacterium]|nr:TrkH family potassium uptake protein [Bacillota bacterium]
MRTGRVFYLLGRVLVVIGLTMLLPLAVALICREDDAWVFGLCMPLTVGLGLIVRGACGKHAAHLRLRDSFLFVTLTWVVAALVGSLPFICYGCFPDPVSALFESVSGFTTTGATAMSDIEAMPQGILIWRSLTHWLGGAGIVMLFMAIMQRDSLSNEGSRVFKAEFSGGVLAERAMARTEDNVMAILKVYLALTGACLICLLLTGLSPLDALNHALSTAATGGFSTKNASVGAFNNPAAEWVVAIFLFLSSFNLALYYLFFVRGQRRKVLRDQELRLFAAVSLIAVLLVFLDIHAHFYTDESVGFSLRQAVFQVMAILSSGGFCTADYDAWPTLSRYILILLIALGGCAGSTASSIKINRVYLAWCTIKRDIVVGFRPQAVHHITYNGRSVSENVTRSVYLYLVLYFVLTIAGTLLCALIGMDWHEAFLGCLASISNVGPAMGSLGPAGNYAAVPWLAKLVMCFLMLAGRLEVYTVMVLFCPSLWRK